jgi:hypothetical protein
MKKNQIATQLPVSNQTEAKSQSAVAGSQSKTSESHGNQAGHRSKAGFLPSPFSLLPFFVLCSLFSVIWISCEQPDSGTNSGGVIVPVADIDGIYTAVQRGTEVDLNGARVIPAAATNKSIVWRVVTGGGTGVTAVEGGKFTPQSVGSVRLQAVIPNGIAAGANFEKDIFVNVYNTADVQITPAGARLPAGGSAQFAAVVVGEENQAVSWSVTGGVDNATTIEQDGTLTVGAEEAQYTALTVTASNGTKSGSVIVNITAEPVTIISNSLGWVQTIAQGGRITFRASAIGDDNLDADWELLGGSGGTNVSNGVLTVDASQEEGSILTLKAVSRANAAVKGEHNLTVVPQVTSFTINQPDDPYAVKGRTTNNVRLSAAANGAGTTSAAWELISEVAPAVGPNVNNKTQMSGTEVRVVAGETADSVTIRATCKADETKTDTIVINIIDAPQVTSVTVSPDTASVGQGGTSESFTATVEGHGSPSQYVKWSITGGTGTTAITDNPGSGIEYTTFGAKLSIAADQATGSNTITITATASDKGVNGISEVSGTASVTVTEPQATVTSVTVSPAKANIPRGYSGGGFTAAVIGTNNPGQDVTWSVTGGTAGTSMTPEGALTVGAGETSATLTVKATSTLDTLKSATATVTVRANDWTKVSGYDTGAIPTTHVVKAFASAQVGDATWYVFSGDSGQVVKNNAGLSGGTWYRFTAANAQSVVATDMASGLYNGTPTMVIVGTLGKMALSNSTTIAGTSTTASTAKWIAIAAGTTTAEKISQFASSETINAIAFGNNIFVAVGTGTISRSTDGGINWTKVASHPLGGYTIVSIAYDESSQTFVAVGRAGSGVKFAYSSDGAAWTEPASTAFQEAFGANCLVTGVARYGNKIVVSGAAKPDGLESTIPKVIISADGGVNWTAANSSGLPNTPISSSILAITHDGTRFIMGGTESFMAYSVDGTDWTRVFINSSVGAPANFWRIKYDGVKYVATGAGGVILSISSF